MAAANQAPTILDYAQQLIAGTSAILALSFGGSPTAANRTGFYGDLTASAEKVCLMVGGQVGPIYTRNGSVVDVTFSGAVTISGNLTVNGTTTTIHSTTVDVDDRVIRVNKSTGANDPAPTNICGISVYRGAVSSVPRDHYGLFWDESATKWKLAVNTGGDDATLGAYLNLQALAITGTTITASTAFVGGTVAGTTASFSGQITSTLAIGTAPLVITSTTLVANLYGARSVLADTVTTNANLTGPITSVGNATSVAVQTGTGSTFVMQASPTLTTPNLGTPSAGVLTNCIGTASGLTAGSVTTNANLTGVITSVGNATSIASQTGTGTKFVVDTSPTLVTPVIGVATGTSLSVSGSLTSTVATGTAPLVVTSTTVVGNLNVSQLLGSTWASPAAIGSGTPAAGTFTIVSGGSGTESAPAHSFSTDPDCGLFRQAANAVGLSTGGQERWRFTSTGSVVLSRNATTISSLSNPTFTNDGMVCHGTDASDILNSINSYGGNVAMVGRTAGGTGATPTATPSGATFALSLRGFGTSFFSSDRASIILAATELWSGTASGSSIQIKVCKDTTLTTAAAVTFAQASTATNPSAVFTGIGSTTDTTDSTSIVTGSWILAGGLGVAKRITIDGGTGKTLRIANVVANAAIAVTFTGVGPTGSTAGPPQGWMRIDANGTDRFIPFW